MRLKKSRMRLRTGSGWELRMWRKVESESSGMYY